MHGITYRFRKQLRSSTAVARLDPPASLLDPSLGLLRVNRRLQSCERTCYPLSLRRLPIAARRWAHSVHVTLHWSQLDFEGGRRNRDEQVYVIGTMDDAGDGSNDTKNPAAEGATLPDSSPPTAARGGASAASRVSEGGSGGDGNGRAADPGDEGSSDGPPLVLPHTQAPPPPHGWPGSRKADPSLLVRQDRRRQRQRLVCECCLVQGGTGAVTVRMTFTPQEGEIYHLWCEMGVEAGCMPHKWCR
jgi:hypothetical protein